MVSALATLRLPLPATRPPAPSRPTIRTAPFKADTALLKVTDLPAGMITFSTLARSGIAPLSQLSGSDQLPLAPPIQATDARRLIWAAPL